MAPLRFMVATLAAVSAAYGSMQEAAPFSNPFVVSLTSWSECRRINGTPSCFRTREASCIRSLDSVIAPWYYCEEIGLERPNGVELCAASSCVQGCVVSAWTDWTDCDCSSSPYANRFREIVIPPQNDGEDCPELVQNATCDCPLSLDDTPRNYTWKVGVWGECTAISADCGLGTRSRTVDCVNLQEDEVSDMKCLWERAYEHVLPPPIMSVCEVPCLCVHSEWSEWSECEAVCDTTTPHGEQRRVRMVLQQPTIGGSCPETEETRNCDVDTSICPHYTWETSEWSTCTFEGGASCGMGLLNRYVYCLEVYENSTLVSDASRCALYTTEPRPSHVAPCQITCPQECIVTEWTDWSPCPVTCNIIYSNRTRDVLIPSLAGGNKCPHLLEFKQCPVVPCVQWITEDFSVCFPKSGSCGAGTQARNLYCSDLAGSEIESDLCATIPTPARTADCYKPCFDDCVVSEWTSWTECSLTCGGEIGTQTRTRDIVVYGTQTCLYKSTSLSEIRNCSVEIPCVDSIYFIRSSEWSDCIAEPQNASGDMPPSLIEGSQTRTSVCMKDDEVIPPDDCPIEFQAVENRSCSVPRPVDCVLSDWSNFSTCSVTCGEGIKTRSRRVIQFASSGGIDCPFNIPSNGLLTETIACQQPSCIMDYSWHVSPWSQCYILPTLLSKHSQEAHVLNVNKHCGVGYQNRSVSCVDSNLHTLDYHLCLGISGEKPTSLQFTCLESCTDQCIITEWSEFSQCMNGASTRTREIIPFEGFTDWRDNCPELANIATIERISCNEIDYNTYAWIITSLWGLECIIESPEATCGAGFQYRSFVCVDTRDITRMPVSEEFCLRTTPPSSKRGCSILCRDNCGMAEWSPWGACSTSCGPGYQIRTRASPQGTASSCGLRNETRICHDNPPCQVVEYQYGRHGFCRPSNASEICGEGVQFREVVCVLNGETQPDTSLCSHLVPPNATASPCTVPCPGQCVVGQWSPWTPCPDVCPDRSCMQKRFREKLRDGLDCPRTIQERSCPVVINYFEWRERDWLDCILIVSGNTDYCGNGTQYRIVECIDSRTNGSVRDDQCSGEKPDTIRPCQIQCPIDCQVGPFSAWTDCPDSCDFSSYQVRSREILILPSDGGRECPSLEQQKPCLPTNCDRYVLEAHDNYCSPEYTVSSTCGSTLSTVPLTCRRNNRFVPLKDCLRAASNRLTVDGPSERESYCNFQCPYQPNCSFTEWSDWSTCKSLCYRPELEGGFSFRSQTLLRAFDSISAVQCLRQQYEQQPCGTDGSTTSEEGVSCVEFHWEALEWTADGTRDTVCQSGTGIEVSDNGCVPAIRPVEINGTCRTECSETGYCNPSTGDCECYHLYEMVDDICLPLSGCFWDGHCLYSNTMCNGESICVCLNGRELQTNGMCVEPPTVSPTVTPCPTMESHLTSKPCPTTPHTDDTTALPTGMVTMTTLYMTEGPTVGVPTEDSQSDSFVKPPDNGEEFINTALKTTGTAISSISMVALTITLVTTIVFRKVRKHNASIFIIQRCIALFCMLLFFLVGIDRVENDITCTIMSLTIQYFTMASVFWMGAEAVLIFQQLITRFERTSWKRILIPSLVCWMLPLPLLAVALATLGTGDNYLISTDERYCFLSQAGVLFGIFIVPLFSTLLFNMVIFILITRVLLRHRRRMAFAGLLKTTTRTLIGAATIMVLFGLTWIFGAVTFTGGPDIFLWLFIISNSLQGLSFCVFQKDAQDAWILLIRCSIHRKRKVTAREDGIMETLAHPAAALASVPSVEFTMEEKFDNGRMKDTLEKEEVGKKSTEENPAVALASVPSVEFTMEEMFDNGRMKDTLENEEVGKKSTEENPAVTLASVPSVEFTMEEMFDNGRMKDTLENEEVGKKSTEANPAAALTLAPLMESRVKESVSPMEEGRGEHETSLFGQDPQFEMLLQPRRILDISHEYIQKLSAQMIIPRKHIRLLNLIGDGEYGIVYKAQICTPERVGSDTYTVALKTLKGFFDESAIDEMVKESLKMKDLNHPNVLNMIGVCIDGGPAPFIVMPFMANGSLRAYLKKERPNIIVPDDAEFSLVLSGRRRLVGMCIQIARGMEYLASKKIVHRDLASRNCMIDGNFVIKVADFGLSESIYAKTYFRLANHSKAKLPLKWMAPESLNDGIFTEKTDVWSFGVVCWEIFTGGKAPYAGVNPLALIEMLEDGHRLNKPRNAACSGETYSIMYSCWHADPANRPPFSNIVQTISQIQNRSPAVPSSTPKPIAEPVMSQVPSERQQVQSNVKPVGEPHQRALPEIAAEQSKQGASAAKPNPQDDYEEITSVYDQLPLPVPEKVEKATDQSYEEISGAVYDSFPVLACKDDTKSPVQLNLAEVITSKRVCKTPSISLLGDDNNTRAHPTNRNPPAIEHHPPQGRGGLVVSYDRKALPYSRSDPEYANIPTLIFVRGEFPVPSRLCTTVRTPKPEVVSEELPKRAIITPHSSSHSHQNAPVVPPKPGVRVAATAGKPKRGTTASHHRETPSDDRGGKVLSHNHGVGSALEVFTKSDNYESISRDPYESAANYESISKDPYESVASPYESISASPYDSIVTPTTSSLPLANHREDDESMIDLDDDGALNDPVQPPDPTAPATS